MLSVLAHCLTFVLCPTSLLKTVDRMRKYRPYAKMTDISLVCIQISQLTSFLGSKMKEHFTFNEASKVNLNADKRMLKCQPFLIRCIKTFFNMRWFLKFYLISIVCMSVLFG